MMLSKWDLRYLSLAEHIAGWSKDPSTKVGAVIVTPTNRILSLGFNGFPRGTLDDPTHLLDRDEKLRRTIHAEENALLFARQDVTGHTVYCTHPPCARCASKLIQSGIHRIVVPKPHESFLERWATDAVSARRMYDEANVAYIEA